MPTSIHHPASAAGEEIVHSGSSTVRYYDKYSDTAQHYLLRQHLLSAGQGSCEAAPAAEALAGMAFAASRDCLLLVLLKCLTPLSLSLYVIIRTSPLTDLWEVDFSTDLSSDPWKIVLKS